MRLMKKMARIIEKDMMKKRANAKNRNTGETLQEQEAVIKSAISGQSGTLQVDDLGDGGKRYLLTFPNGFNLSIISTESSYGVEAALRVNDEKTVYDKKFGDVAGYLDEDGIKELISYVEGLSSDHKYYDTSYGWESDEDEDDIYYDMPGYHGEDREGPYGGAFRSERDLARHLGIDYD